VTTLDLPDWSPAAYPISTDGNLASVAAQVIAASSSFQVYSGAISGASYAISLDGLISSAATIPFARVSLIWKDVAGGQVIDIQHWVIPTTNVSPANSNTLITGRGPARSQHVTVLLENYDPAQPLTADAYFYQSSRVVTRDDWRSISDNTTFATPAGLTTANGNYLWTTPDSDPANNIPGFMAKVAIPNGGYQGRMNAVYCGQYYLVVSKDDNVNTLLITVVAINPDVVPGGGEHPFIFQEQLTGYQFTGYITAPRGPVVVFLQNQGPNTINNVLYSLIDQEFAS
jgi:hypothetical protein